MKPDPNPIEANDGKSTPKGGVLKTDSSMSWTQFVPNPALLLKTNRRLVDALKAHLKPVYRQIPAFAQGPDPEADRARFERVFRPWPKWVLRLAVDLWHVNFPTIDRVVLFKAFRTVNAVLFRCPSDPDDTRSLIFLFKAGRSVDAQVIKAIQASLFGHWYEHFEARKKTLEMQFATGEINQEIFEQEMKQLMPELINELLSEEITRCKDNAISPFLFARIMEQARQKTFDKHGKLKEPPLISIYRMMLANWIIIENMSGPKALTHFLWPALGERNFFVAHGRVRKICSRLGIRFKAAVKDS